MTRILQALALTAALSVSALATAAQPHMEAALAKLKEAKAELNQASDDKGGHRVNAIKAVDHAIEQVQKGMAFDAKNGGDKDKK